jgi:hypothetical protein
MCTYNDFTRISRGKDEDEGLLLQSASSRNPLGDYKAIAEIRLILEPRDARQIFFASELAGCLCFHL